MSEAIVRLVTLARDAGLASEDGEWSKAFVYWFDAFMPTDVRTAGDLDSSLNYFESQGTPHTPAGEGFIDRDAKTSISFLLKVQN